MQKTLHKSYWVEQRQVTVPQSHFVPDGRGGSRSEQLPDLSELVEVSVDLDTLFRLYAATACNSQEGKCRLLTGAVVLRRVDGPRVVKSQEEVDYELEQKRDRGAASYPGRRFSRPK